MRERVERSPETDGVEDETGSSILSKRIRRSRNGRQCCGRLSLGQGFEGRDN